MAKEDVNVNEMMHDPMADGGKYARYEIHGREATGGPLDPPKKKNKPSPLEKSMMKGYKTESALGKMLVTGEKGVKKIAPNYKDEYGNEIKDKNRAKHLAHLAKKAAAMKTFATKKGA